MSATKEGLLRPPVSMWLDAQGYTPVFEVCLSGCCDIVGANFAERIGRRVPEIRQTCAVELKLHDIAGVLQQAKGNCWHVNYSWAAMPKARISKCRPQTLRQFEDAGVGLLAVDGDAVEVVIQPKRNDIQHKFIHRKLWRRRREWRDRLKVNRLEVAA